LGICLNNQTELSSHWSTVIWTLLFCSTACSGH